MTAHMRDVVLPGPELEVRAIDDRNTPIVVRIVSVSRHGNAFRYELEWYGLVPGQFDLRDYLRRKDGSRAADLPPLPLQVAPLLPKGQMIPHDLTVRPVPSLGGYSVLVVSVLVLWVIGLVAILFVRRRRKQRHLAGAARQLTVADRLRPLVERAVAGQISLSESAELERTLLAFWRRRLGLESERPGEALAALRRHPEAGQLLEQLEIWLHRPGPPATVDIAALLRPYQNIPEEAPALAATTP
jgi:hypothetical protein